MNKKVLTIWENCLRFVGDNITVQEYKTWFAPIVPIGLEGDVLSIEVPSKFFYEWIEEHYIKLLKIALVKELGKEAKLVYNIKMENSKPSHNRTINIPSFPKRNIHAQEVETAKLRQDVEVKNPFVIPGLKKITINPQLNDNYTLDNFIEGEANRLARSAAFAIAKRPGGTSFNPLFIHGGVGLGKTHLANAIGIEVKELHPQKTVLYVSAERFTQQYISAVKNNTRNDFIHFYQMIDVLIVDDIHFMSGKKSTQVAFFHVFNHLHQNGKQLIFTSDKSPIEIQDMEQRLISRFKWGLSCDLLPPDFETRMSILKSKLYRDGIDLDPEVVTYIARHVVSNVRELEGALISIMAQSSLNKKNIDIALTKRILTGFVSQQAVDITVDSIQQAVCDYFKIKVEDIQSRTRKREIVQARQLAMYFSKKYTKNSLSKIGKHIGSRDHATVLHACKTVENLAETDKIFQEYVNDIEKKLER